MVVVAVVGVVEEMVVVVEPDLLRLSTAEATTIAREERYTMLHYY